MIRSIPRSLTLGITALLVAFVLGTPASAGSFLPRLRLPKINLGKGVAAAAYPVTKAVVNGGKTVIKTAATAETLGVLPSVGPPGVNSVVKKIVVTIGRH